MTLEKYLGRTAVGQTEQLQRDENRHLEISVNRSAATIVKEEMVEYLIELSKSHAIQAGCVYLEVTEQDVLENSMKTSQSLNRLKQFGFRLAIDDFSMGNTSMYYLQENSFDCVKLDGGISIDVGENARVRGIVSSIVHLSRTLGFGVCAEYVETQEQYDWLKELGCTIYQGYLFSPAIPYEEFYRHLKSCRQ